MNTLKKFFSQSLSIPGIFICLLISGCDHHHKTYFPPGTCELYYNYQPNAGYGIRPVVTCDVRNAVPYASADCYMEFSAVGYKLVTDRSTVSTNFYGDALLNVANGNCYNGESVQLYASCSIDGVVVNSFNTGYRLCGY